MRARRPLVVLAAFAGLVACEEEPDPPPEEQHLVLWLAVDGVAEVSLDGEVVGNKGGYDLPDSVNLTAFPGEHELTIALSEGGETGPALAAWIELGGGGFMASDDSWSGAEDRGGYGSAPWRWAPAAMMGTGARWIAPDGGGEGTVATTLTVTPLADLWEVYPRDDHVAGEVGRMTLRFTAGAAGLAAGEVRTIAHTPLDGSWSREMPYPRWSGWQTADPGAPGYLEVGGAPDGVEARLAVEEVESELGPNGPYVDGGRLTLSLELAEGALEAHEQVVILWEGEPGVTAPLQARRYTFPHPGCETPASMDYPGATTGRCPAVEVGGAEAATLRVAPRGGIVAVGAPLAVRVAALDEVGNLAGEVHPLATVESSDPDAELPAEVWLDGPEVVGTVEFEITFASPGWHRIEVEAGEARGAATVRVTSGTPERELYFGDLHAHTLESDGIWHAEASYRHADEVACHDFAAVTDHGERLTDTEWAAARDRAATMTHDGFLVLAAYEWTAAATMHRNVYGLTPGDDFPLVRTASFGNGDDPVTTASALIEAVQGRALTIPHHPGSVVTAAHGWSEFDAAVEPVVEIYSKHGSSECWGCEPAIEEAWAQTPGNYVRDALAAGHRVGFIGSSDAHDAALGSAAPDLEDVFGPGDYGPTPLRGGLAAVWAEELTLDGILTALQQRRCYATTGARIAMEFTIDGEPMGSELQGDGPAVLTFAVGGTDDLDQVLVVRYRASDGWTHPSLWTPDDPHLEGTWADPDEAESAIYYLHVVQADGHHAWSSPIWVDR